MPDKEDEIGALWVRTSSKGTQFLSGKINGVDVVIFKNSSDNPKAPQWRVYKSQPIVKQQTRADSGGFPGNDVPFAPVP